jgi:hypothetical protein
MFHLHGLDWPTFQEMVRLDLWELKWHNTEHLLGNLWQISTETVPV